MSQFFIRECGQSHIAKRDTWWRSGLNGKILWLGLAVCLSAAAPGLAYGENMNLTGSLNVNDMQVTSTSNLLLSMLVTLAESIIPILVGAAVGHKSITHWQEKKDVISRKNSILENYSLSFKMHNSLLDNFVNKIFREYVVFEKDGNVHPSELTDNTSQENKIEGYLRFPRESGESPSVKFHDEYMNLFSKIDDVSSARDRLYLDLRVFRRGADRMIERLQEVRKLLFSSEIVLLRLMESTNGDDFLGYRDRYESLSRAIKKATDKIDSDLASI